MVADRRGVGSNLIEHPVISVSCLLDLRPRMRQSERHHTQAHFRYSSKFEGCPQGDMSLAIIARSGWHAMGRRIGTLYVWVNKAYSQGSVRLASTAVGEEPIIDFRMLSDDRDMVRLRQALPVRVGARAIGERREDFQRGFPGQLFRSRAASVVARPAQSAPDANVCVGAWTRFRRCGSWLVKKFVTEGASLSEVLSDDAILDAYITKCVTGVWHRSGLAAWATRAIRWPSPATAAVSTA